MGIPDYEADADLNVSLGGVQIDNGLIPWQTAYNIRVLMADIASGLGEAATPTFSKLTIDESDQTAAGRELLLLKNNGGGFISIENTSTSDTWFITHENASPNRLIFSTGSNPSKRVAISSDGTVEIEGPFVLASYTVAGVPTAVAGGLIYVSDETGGPVMAFSDGTNWRRMTDRAVVS